MFTFVGKTYLINYYYLDSFALLANIYRYIFFFQRHIFLYSATHISKNKHESNSIKFIIISTVNKCEIQPIERNNTPTHNYYIIEYWPATDKLRIRVTTTIGMVLLSVAKTKEYYSMFDVRNDAAIFSFKHS